MSTVDDVKQKIDIVDVVSSYVKLQKSGKNFKANCPFHAEKAPSFFVFPEKQSWHCFGACGTGGDVFSFVMKKEGLDFSAALHQLAEKAGIPLVFQTDQKTKEDNERQKRLFAANEVASEYFHYLLLHSDEAATARQYVNKREISSSTIESFQLGYAPNSWDALRVYLAKSGYSDEEMLAAGLIVPRDKGGYYDRFRNRLMFPIKDIKGRVLGFGGRSLDDSLPKYLNSPQTALFDKSSVIYAIDKAQAAIRQKDSLIITEGYMDTITSHQYGFDNTVACMGTALTEKQISALRKLSKNIIFALDADQAGLEATARSILTIDNQIPTDHWMPWIEPKTYGELVKHEIQVISIEGGKDPDEIIRKSPEQWKKLLNSSQPIIDFTFKKEIDRIDQNNPKDKSTAVSKFLPILAQIEDPVRRAHYIQKLSKLLLLDERAVRDALMNLLSIEKKDKTARKTRAIKNYAVQAASSRSIEIYCLALLLHFPDLKKAAKSLDDKYFEHSENRDILLKWQSSQDIDTLANDLDPAMREHFDHLLLFCENFPRSLEMDAEERTHALEDCINRLQENYYRNLEIQKKMVLSAEWKEGDSESQLARLKEQGINESQQLHDIFRKRGRLSRSKGRLND